MDPDGGNHYGTVRTVVWEDGGGDPASYPIGAQKTYPSIS